MVVKFGTYRYKLGRTVVRVQGHEFIGERKYLGGVFSYSLRALIVIKYKKPYYFYLARKAHDTNKTANIFLPV